jgi:cell division protein FtsB
MSSIKEKLQNDLAAAQTSIASYQSTVTQIEQQIANLPPEVETIAEEAWDRVKAFFQSL